MRIFFLALLILAFLVASAQLVTPYIAHDDLDFLMPPGWRGGYVTPWQNTLAEGRWINYLWYQVSMHLAPTSAYLLFIIAYFLLVAAVSAHVGKGNRFILCGLAIFFSPMFGALSLWPSALFSGVVLSGASIWLLMCVEDRLVPFVVLAAAWLLVLAYPPLASLVLLVAALREGDATARRKLAIGVLYVLGFGLGVLSIYLLNLGFHGHFGVEVAGWRRVGHAQGLPALVARVGAYGNYWHQLAHAHASAMVIGGIAAVLLLSQVATRRRAVAILLAVALVCLIELGITLVSGAGFPLRASVWLWLAICLLCALVATQPSRPWRWVGAALLLALVYLGAGSWWRIYRWAQPTPQYEARLALQIHQYQATTGYRTVAIMGNPRRVPSLRGLLETDPLPALQMALRIHGIKADPCSVETCADARAWFRSHPVQPILPLDGQLVLVFDPEGRGLPIERDYPTTPQEKALKLNYPTFVRYGNNSVRIVPFVATDRHPPMSVRLAPNAAGYVLGPPTSACRYPIDYVLTGDSGVRLAAGSYHAGASAIDLPGWSNATGDGILTVTMAVGSKNNYSCNVMVSRKGP